MNPVGTFGLGQVEALRRLVTEAFVGMLASCGQAAERIQQPKADSVLTERHMAGLIAFSGGVHGSLVIAASSAVFQRTYPQTPGFFVTLSSADLLDWAGEMANQTLGQIKRRFCERGVNFEVSTPTAVNGRHIGARAPSREGIIDLAFAVGDEIARVCFEIVATSDGPVFRDGAEPIECVAEGDLVLF